MSKYRTRPLLALPLLLALGVATGVSTAAEIGEEGVMPRYDASGALLLPADYATWVFAGSSIGLSYGEGGGGMEMFHHTLIEPSAYRHFAETGEFREGTMLALLLHGLGEGVLPSRRGRFAADLHAVELAVKDSSRFEEGWAYYNFGSRTGLLERAEAFAKESCYSCHLEHAAHDNVFLQFYPLLAAAAPAGTVSVTPKSQVRNETSHQANRQSGDQESPEEGATETAAETPATPPAPLALRGLDPVLLTKGREELGKPEIVMTHSGYRYQFISEPSRARFEEKPERFSIQNSSCLVVPGAPNNPALFAVHDERIYAFASANCVAQFEADPETFLPGPTP